MKIAKLLKRDVGYLFPEEWREIAIARRREKRGVSLTNTIEEHSYKIPKDVYNFSNRASFDVSPIFMMKKRNLVKF